MVEENVQGVGLRLDGGNAEPEPNKRPEVFPRPVVRGGGDVLVLNNNNNNNNGRSSSASSTTSTGTTSASTPSTSSNNAGPGHANSSSSMSGGAAGSSSPPHDQIPNILQPDDAVGKRLSSSSSPIDKRSSLSEKSVSPIEINSPPIERRNGSSTCASPIDKSHQQQKTGRRSLVFPSALEKTRAGGSGGSVDSRSDSPINGGNIFRERLRITTTTNSSQLFGNRSSKDFVDGVDDNEPPGPAPSSRPCSPGHPFGIGNPVVASRLSNLHGGGASHQNSESTSNRRLRLENERLIAEVARLRRLLLSGGTTRVGQIGTNDDDEALQINEEARFVALEMELQRARENVQSLKADRKRLRAEKFDLLNQMKALYGTLEDKERELRDFIRNYEQRMRESEANLGRMQQPGINTEEREMERERERWSLLRAARDEADRSLTLAASLADKEAALTHAHATIKELQRQLTERNGGTLCLSDQESLLSFPRGSVNGATTPGAGSNNGIVLGGNHLGVSSQQQQQQQTGSTGELGTNVNSIPSLSSSGGVGGLVTIVGQAGDRGSCSADSGVRGSSDRESGGATSIGGNLSDSTTDGTPPAVRVDAISSGIEAESDSVSVVSSAATSSLHVYASTCSPTLSPLNAFSRSMDNNNSSLSRSVEQLSSPLDAEPNKRGFNKPSAIPLVPQTVHSRSSATRGGTWGSISRVFARTRHRKATSSSSGVFDGSGLDVFDPYRSWSPLTEEGYAEKLKLLREAASIPMERWRAPTVLAWIEVALGMPQYGLRCAENIKSGKVLLEMSDAELEAGLGVTHALHRKKLRLAIEEHRHPNLVRYPCMAQLGHTWVSSEWLPDLGLAQYAESFAINMVDARMLDNLSKKELEKYLGVTRKFHQASVVHGINLLRMLNYDRQALAIRRHNCEQIDVDPLVWTNQRFVKWARKIDLAEYADNLKESGVHGALVVLEPSFTGDTMATALGIPPAKQMIRRHLTAELEAIVLPARYSVYRNPDVNVLDNNGSIH